MQRTLFAFLTVFTLAFAVLFSAGCGGGGGGGSNGGGGGSNGGRPPGTISIQYIVGTAPGSSTTRSIGNLLVGDVVDLRSLAIYTTVNGYSGGFLEDVSGVTVSAPGVATLSGTRLTAIGVGTGTVSLTGADGVVLNGTISVSSVGSGPATVTGRVRRVLSGTTNAGIASALVRFFNADGAEVASAITGPDGRYVANVPSSATTFVADFANLPNSFYNQFTYNGIDYTAAPASGGMCGVPISLSAGSSVELEDAIGYRKSSGSPPAPPTEGCG